MGKLKKAGGGRASLIMMRPAFLPCIREQEKSGIVRHGGLECERVGGRGFVHTCEIANRDRHVHLYLSDVFNAA